MIELAWGIFAGFWTTEILSYFMHRYLFHGLLWPIHHSHHKVTEGLFEDNDLFSLFFAIVSIALIVSSRLSYISSFWLWFGLGIALYGLLYFVIHDLMTHRRFIPLKASSKLTLLLSKAHLIHHQRHDKKGQEPFGLFLVHPDIIQKLKTRLRSK